jgi:hypothetical protein
MHGMPSFRPLFLSLTLLLAGAACFAATPPAQAGLQIVNIMPAFWEFEGKSKDLASPADQAALFRKLVLQPHMDIYSMDEFAKNLTDEGIEKYLGKVAPYLDTMRTVSGQIGDQVPAAQASFMHAFPDFKPDISVAFMPSLRHFDGQTTQLKDGRTVILFGVDAIAEFHGENADLPVLFSHELFHVYHAQVNPDLFPPNVGGPREAENVPLYEAVWIEGLATYVSGALNPQAPVQDLLLNKKLYDEGMPALPVIASRILAKFDSTTDPDNAAFLQGGVKSDIPPRSGYLAGYLMAKDLSGKYSLAELAHLTGPALRTAIHDELTRMAAATQK